MSRYDQWLESGDPGQGGYVCEHHGDTSETGEARKVPQNPTPGTHTVEVKMACGCWINEDWHYEADMGWL
jgi:hypothetical protein